MKQADVVIGKTYMMKVSGRLAPVKIISTATYCKWIGTNIRTGRTIHIHSAAKLRGEYKGIGEYVAEIKARFPRAITISTATQIWVQTSSIGLTISRAFAFLTDGEGATLLAWASAAKTVRNLPPESRSVCAVCGREAVGDKSLCCETYIITPSEFAGKISAQLTESSQAR